MHGASYSHEAEGGSPIARKKKKWKQQSNIQKVHDRTTTLLGSPSLPLSLWLKSGGIHNLYLLYASCATPAGLSPSSSSRKLKPKKGRGRKISATHTRKYTTNSVFCLQHGKYIAKIKYAFGKKGGCEIIPNQLLPQPLLLLIYESSLTCTGSN